MMIMACVMRTYEVMVNHSKNLAMVMVACVLKTDRALRTVTIELTHLRSEHKPRSPLTLRVKVFDKNRYYDGWNNARTLLSK